MRGSNLTKQLNLILFSASALLIAGGASCDKGVEPPPPPKSPREYSWTVQEISSPYFQVLATDVWGSATNDVYVTCLSGGTRGYKLFHFDGSQWSEVDIAQFGSSQVSFDLNAISGFDQMDIWAVGVRWYSNPSPEPNYLDSSLVIHFNGSQWSEVSVTPKQRMLKSIGAIFPSDIWFGGLDAAVYHYDGLAVRGDSLGALISDKGGHNLIVGWFEGNSSGNLFAFFNDFTTGYFHFLNRSGNNWSELDSQFATQTSLWISPSGRLFSTFYGHGLYVWDGQAPWTPFYTEGNASVRLFGKTDNNIFVTGPQGGLHHYNGTDWYKFKNLESTTISFIDVWTDGSEVFVIGDDGFRSYIYHGK